MPSKTTQSKDVIRKMRKRAKADLYYFAKVICGMHDLQARFHLPMARFLQMYPWNGGPPESLRKCLVLSREHFKSSIGTVARALWLLCHNPEWTICLMSAKEDHPKKWLRQIKQIIEQNPIFQSVFPEIQKDPAKWDDMEILIKRPTSLTGQAQASITAASMLAGQASQHYDHIIVDDPVNERIAKSEPLMNEAKNTRKITRLAALM
jgi:hypothetical protein